tara:strand:+ start:225 stop:533 length:309 start_codon:yes stop_codon:yes gene_type:complete
MFYGCNFINKQFAKSIGGYMKWAKSSKKLKKYKIVLIKDYVDVINIALDGKADWHFSQNNIVKNKLGEDVNIDHVLGNFCLMIKNCINTQYKLQRRRVKHGS